MVGLKLCERREYLELFLGFSGEWGFFLVGFGFCLHSGGLSEGMGTYDFYMRAMASRIFLSSRLSF